ncbi:MAG: glycosyltransferase family 2 protein [Candidatus Binatia bacterium]
MPSLVSIVIPVLNGGPVLEEALEVIRQQRGDFSLELLCLDSGSRDGSRDICVRYGARIVDVPPGTFNHGATRNQGIALSRGEFVVMLVQDAVPVGGQWLATLLRNFVSPAVAGVYCRQRPRADADVLTKRQLENWIAGKPDRVEQQLNGRSWEALTPWQRLELSTFDDVCACLRRSVWEHIPYQATYFGEDIEWGKRVIQAGYTLVYEPEAAVIHSHARSPWYEYKRTYLCHRRLYELFGLHTVPTRCHAWGATLNGIRKDAVFVWRQERDFVRRFSLLFRLPLLVGAAVFGQYYGARDERQRKPLKEGRGV